MRALTLCNRALDNLGHMRATGTSWATDANISPQRTQTRLQTNATSHPSPWLLFTFSHPIFPPLFDIIIHTIPSSLASTARLINIATITMAGKTTNWESTETWQRVVASIIASGVKVCLSLSSAV